MGTSSSACTSSSVDTTCSSAGTCVVTCERPCENRSSKNEPVKQIQVHVYPRCEVDLEHTRQEGNVYFVSASALSRILAREFDIIFNYIDTDFNGTLEKADVELFLQVMEKKKMVLTAHTAAEVMRTMDTNSDVKISRQEFHNWLHNECAAKRENLFKLLPDRLWLDTITDRAFKSADTDGKGQIDTVELDRYLAEVSKQLGEEACKHEVWQFDQDKDGKLSKWEFRHLIKALIVDLYISEVATSRH